MSIRHLAALLVLVGSACSGSPAPTSVPDQLTTTPATSLGPVTTADPPATTSAVTPSRPDATAPASAASTEAALPLVGVTVVFDPGHNGRNAEFPDEINPIVDIGNGTKACNTTGTTTDDGYPEAQFNWEVAELAVASLEALGPRWC